VKAIRTLIGFLLTLSCLFLARLPFSKAQTDPGRIIYSKFADSALLVFVADDKGQPVVLGPAFMTRLNPR
jgi:hypothetical protein